MPYLLRSSGPYGLKLQLIEADRLVNRDNKRDTDGARRWRADGR